MMFVTAFQLAMEQRAALRSQDLKISNGLKIEDARISADDEDGESEGYKVPSSETRAFAVDLANRIVRAIPWRDGRSIPLPRLASAPDGGVSLHWRSTRFEILVVIPPDLQRPIEYYGDTPNGDVTKGSFTGSAQAKSIAEWIAAYEFPA